ncbi:class I SAM-dependent methyltransferase [Methanonatronarchaeum sp. AMET-Sl]|uniref:class I SAM-dependent methyltransferase n=1 Tax=Methanonatronarchaeum sp. AMET-Sl TaxID=3037654 RepID=UPI00244DD90E|nr:class I SAM-dependent methyltransferase [Methanonatronarchaeum sp. AMET-Sl]WGI18019.1 class I SAM-dependent methyltransferase [Methanonatronarchaeum sp. AMET-Sl]
MGDVVEVDRSFDEALDTYRFYSRFYRLIEVFELPVSDMAFSLLGDVEGSCVLEVGCGVGGDLVRLGERVGVDGCVVGLDSVYEMVCRSRERDGGVGGVEVVVGDARCLPFGDSCFDGVFMKGVLELFKIREFELVLGEVLRVLRPGGWFLVGSLSREGFEDSLFVRLYEWLHIRFPRYFDCRPIYLERLLRDNGFVVDRVGLVVLFGFVPFKVVLAYPGLD